MKKKTFALALMAIYVAVLVGGSLAYFTAEDRAVNVITIGSVDIEIEEYDEDGKLIIYDETQDDKGMPESFKNIEPGQNIIKKVDIKNRGKNAAWIRAKIVDSITAAEKLGSGKLPTNVVKYNINALRTVEQMDGEWILDGEYWYYSKVVQPGEVITLFDVVAFDGPSMGNAYQGCITNIQIFADAVQSEGNAVLLDDATNQYGADPASWPLAQTGIAAQGGAD